MDGLFWNVQIFVDYDLFYIVTYVDEVKLHRLISSIFLQHLAVDNTMSIANYDILLVKCKRCKNIEDLEWTILEHIKINVIYSNRYFLLRTVNLQAIAFYFSSSLVISYEIFNGFVWILGIDDKFVDPIQKWLVIGHLTFMFFNRFIRLWL